MTLKSIYREITTKKFIECIEVSVRDHFKVKSVCNYSKPWMSEKVKKAIKTYRKLKRKNRKWDNPTSAADMNEAKSKLDYLIHDAMQNHWKNFQGEIQDSSQNNFWKKITNLINDKSNHAVQPIYDKETKDLVWEDAEILEKLTNVHIKRNHAQENFNFDETFKEDIDKQVEEILIDIDNNNLQDVNIETLNSPITLKETLSAIDKLNGNGSPGPPTTNKDDPGLPPIILKLGKDIIAPYLHILIQNLWYHGSFPKCLKRDKKIFIPKPGKDDYTLEKSYRMLTLSPCIAKIYDSIFSERFYTWLEKIKFDENQFAYRKNLSCQMAMFKFLQHIQENTNNDNVTISVFLDLEGALMPFGTKD